MNNRELSSVTGQSPLTLHSWRTEPGIDSDRQQFLSQCLTIIPDIQQGIYPFKDVRLTRADVEWLLIKHEQGRGPIEWNDATQRERQGLDLRGANLQHVNLRGLPLACLCGGLTKEEWVATLEQRAMAGVHFERADLSEANLQGALLRGAFLQGATLRATRLEQAILFQAHLERAYLRNAHLEGTNMMSVHLEGTYLRKAWLTGADLRHAICDNTTNLEKVTLHDRKWGCTLLADVHWGDCNLAVIDDWQSVVSLGDEVLAHALSISDRRAGSFKEKHHYLDTFSAAVRAYRQLANAMRAQGMNEEAVPFAYRAQVLQREVLWRQVLWGQISVSQTDILPGGFRQILRNRWRRLRSFGAYIFSWFLDVLAGYGYKPGRSLSIYLLMVTGFTICYLVLGHLALREALIFSVTAFHGRGFFPGPFALSDPVTALAALEAVVGLFIEISFIATFTQRFFGR